MKFAPDDIQPVERDPVQHSYLLFKVPPITDFLTYEDIAVLRIISLKTCLKLQSCHTISIMNNNNKVKPNYEELQFYHYLL